MTNLNDFVGFKCLHYSVTESSGYVELCIVKVSTAEYTFGVRTIEGPAKEGKDYKPYN